MPTKTRAALSIEYGQPIVVDEIELPDPGPMQVLVKQFASGICHSQLHQLHMPQLHRPILLGHEATGVVMETGPDVASVKAGDHVLVGLFARNAHPGMPRHQTPMVSYKGQQIAAGFGSHTWSEWVVSDERWLVKIGPDVPTDVTAVVGCAVMTGAGAVINTAKVPAGASVAVYGVGGLGLCTVQAAHNAGADPIIAVDVAQDKLELSKHFGATHTINAAKEDPVAAIKELTHGGADYAFDVIGATKTMEQVIPSVRPGVFGYDEGGTAVLVGQPMTQPVIPVRDLFGGARKFIGCAGGTGHPELDFPMYIRWFQEGKLPLDELVTRRYSLTQVNEACDALEKGEILGRSIIELS
ncbi:MAG: zinc-binding dehydrogenase [Chloroflexota bacterium]